MRTPARDLAHASPQRAGRCRGRRAFMSSVGLLREETPR